MRRYGLTTSFLLALAWRLSEELSLDVVEALLRIVLLVQSLMQRRMNDEHEYAM